MTWLMLLTHAPVHAQEPQPQVEAQQLAAISPYLEAELTSAPGPTSFLVILDEQADAQAVASSAIGAAQTGEAARIQRAETIYRTLTSTALRSQAPLRAWLDARGVAYRPFYIVNMIEVQGDAELAQALRAAPGVNRLAANPLVLSQEPVVPSLPADWLSLPPQGGLSAADTWPYGLPYTHAPEVWDLGYTGQGIVVASQDTGVQWDHPALIDRYRGWDASTSTAVHPYNWFDAWTTPDPADLCGPDHQIPCDDDSHGTHTVGTMVGDATNDASSSYTQIGMAPGAQWIGCRNMRNNYGTPASYTACFEFMLAPYPQDGDPFTDGRPELAPHILNNSWRCPPSEGCDDVQILRQVVETARAAGQLVVASANNFGPACYSVIEPIGLYDAAFSVGAHDASGVIAGFSSRGPVTIDGSNRLKPDITAPGELVLSAIPPNGYGYKRGTSMSSPHVSGAAALLWSAAPDLIGDIDLTEQALIKSATPVDDNACMDGQPATSPNPTYGYGRLNALAAVMLARTTWLIAVKAVDEAGEPYAELPVVFIDSLTGYSYTSRTGQDGFARLRPVLSGSYTLRLGSGTGTVVRPDVELPLAEDPDIGERRRRFVVTVPRPTGLDVDPQPAPAVFLPLLEQ